MEHKMKHLNTYTGPVVHHRIIVIRYSSGVGCLCLEISFLAILDIFKMDCNILVTVSTSLFMLKTHGVPNFVNGHGELLMVQYYGHCVDIIMKLKE